MEVRELKISIPPEIDTQILLGGGDSNLRIIENRFDAAVTVRNSSITVRGVEREVNYIDKVFKELFYIIKRTGKLTTHDVDTVIGLVGAGEEVQQSKEDLESIILFTKNDVIRAKTGTQQEYCKMVKKNDIVFAIGPAGTGKTYLAVAMAVAALKNREVTRLVLARPAVEAGESLGFLPGGLSEKVDPYLRPLLDALGDMISIEKLATYLDKRVIEIVPLAYMRGRTLNNACVILDEAQNATAMQMKMFLTRLGNGSRAIITGDITQIDLPARTVSGLVDAERILTGIEGIAFVHFNKADVVRHRLVKDIIDAYEKKGESV